MKIQRKYLSLILLFIFYSVGIFGLTNGEFKHIFLLLTPTNLLLTLVILGWAHRKIDLSFFYGFLWAFLIGFFVEVAGVHTGVLFGIYEYGQPLGWKLFEVPLLIGVNWFLLGYAAGGTARMFTKHRWGQVLIAAFLMVVLDIFIEPVAIHLDFWQWDGGEVPLQNYFMWFVTAVVVQVAIQLSGLRPRRMLGLFILLIQFYFFGVLNLFI
jgi:putative membrane protein